jgi:benzodiazapine receptor
MNAWYRTLNRPPLTPPDWIFGPVWTILYIMIAVSIVLYLRSDRKHLPALTISILVIHLAANFVWTYLFFRLKSPFWALMDIVVLDLTLIALIFLFHKASRLSAGLLLPYMAWVSFATYLNAGFLRLN